MVLVPVPPWRRQDCAGFCKAQRWTEDAALRSGLLFLGGASLLWVLRLLDLSFLWNGLSWTTFSSRLCLIYIKKKSEVTTSFILNKCYRLLTDLPNPFLTSSNPFLTAQTRYISLKGTSEHVTFLPETINNLFIALRIQFKILNSIRTNTIVPTFISWAYLLPFSAFTTLLYPESFSQSLKKARLFLTLGPLSILLWTGVPFFWLILTHSLELSLTINSPAILLPQNYLRPN